jgi:anaerobic magnesium-protoporphyrin IX monomethyl ester cyclase
LNILLLCPPYDFHGYTPTGLLSVAQVADELGHHVQVWDCNLNRGLPSVDVPDLVGITGMDIWREQILMLARVYKALGSRVVVGGPWATLRPEDVLSNPAVDAVVEGDGEEAFAELLADFPKLKRRYRHEVRNLDDTPMPSWSSVNLKGYDFVIVQTSRGCPFDCCFCNVRLITGRRFRVKSPERVVREMEEAIKRGAKKISLGDDDATLSKVRFNRICELIIEKGIKTEFDVVAGVRADCLDYGLMVKMKQAGFRELTVGVESGNQKYLDEKIRKHLNLEKVIQAFERGRELGIIMSSFFVIGFYDETREQMEETLRLAERLRQVGRGRSVFTIATPIEGTRLYDEAKAAGCIEGNHMTSLYHEWTPSEVIEMKEYQDRRNLWNWHFNGTSIPVKAIGLLRVMKRKFTS